MPIYNSAYEEARRLVISVNDWHDRGGWAAIFGRQHVLELEIGFGWDPFILEEAVARPEVDFIGLEYDRQRVMAQAKKAAKQKIENVRLIHGSAFYCIPRYFTPSQLGRVCIHFPDPWPKKRHRKNRLLDPDFLKILLYHMSVGATLIVATDSASYAEEIDTGLGALEGLRNRIAPHPWVNRLTGHRMTKFEQMFRSQGKDIHYFSYGKEPAFDRMYGPAVETYRQRIPERMIEMPHAVFNQQLDLERLAESCRDFHRQEGETHFRITDIWLSTQRPHALLECVLVHEGFDTLFFMELKRKKTETVVKISPLVEVERNELIFRFLAVLVRELAQLFPKAEVVRQNLGRFWP